MLYGWLRTKNSFPVTYISGSKLAVKARKFKEKYSIDQLLDKVRWAHLLVNVSDYLCGISLCWVGVPDNLVGNINVVHGSIWYLLRTDIHSPLDVWSNIRIYVCESHRQPMDTTIACGGSVFRKMSSFPTICRPKSTLTHSNMNWLRSFVRRLWTWMRTVCVLWKPPEYYY